MRTAKVKIYYGNLSDDQLTTLAGKIVGAMEANTYFPDPSVSIEALSTLVEDHRLKTELAVNGGSSLDKRLRDESRIALLKSLRALAYYINVQADGNLPALTSSGMLLEKPQTDSGLPEQVEHVQIEDGAISGQIYVSFQRQNNMSGYEIETGQLDESNMKIEWTSLRHTTRSKKNPIEPLIPGQRYYVRVRARNNKGAGDWSEPVSIIAR